MDVDTDTDIDLRGPVAFTYNPYNNLILILQMSKQSLGKDHDLSQVTEGWWSQNLHAGLPTFRICSFYYPTKTQ